MRLSPIYASAHWKLTASLVGLDPPFQGFYRISTKDQTLDGVKLKKGDRVFANIGAANQSVGTHLVPSEHICSTTWF